MDLFENIFPVNLLNSYMVCTLILHWLKQFISAGTWKQMANSLREICKTGFLTKLYFQKICAQVQNSVFHAHFLNIIVRKQNPCLGHNKKTEKNP